MAARTSIFLDPRYRDFVKRYSADPLRFAVEVLRMKPSADQESLFRAIRPKNAKVSVVSGTGTGKTAAFGAVVLWHLLAMPVAIVEGKVEIGSNTYVAAPVVQQVGDGVWKEIADWVMAMRNGPQSWICDYFEVLKTRIYMKGYGDQWFVAQVALRRGEAVSIAGKHRYWQLIIIDEAAGVSDDHMNVIEGTQTSPGNRTLMASQGVRNTGRFFHSHHSLSVDRGGSWTNLRFNSERSPFVTTNWLKQRAIESGGRSSVEYGIRVRGIFADATGYSLLSRAEVEEALKPRKVPLIGEHEPFGWMLLGDVGMGEYRDDSVLVVAKVIGDADFGPEARRVVFTGIPVCTNAKNEIDFSGDLHNAQRESDNGTMYVDNGGVGATVIKLIERAGGVVQKVDWGKPCFSRAYQSRYFNLRACAMVRFRDALRQGRVEFAIDHLPMRVREKIIDQASSLPYHYSETGGLRYVMMRKEDMRKEGIKSPDIWDAMSFVFLEGATYTPRSGTTAASASKSGVASALERLQAAMQGLSEEQGLADG